jgi:hypothetical protein
VPETVEVPGLASGLAKTITVFRPDTPVGWSF